MFVLLFHIEGSITHASRNDDIYENKKGQYSMYNGLACGGYGIW